MTLAFIFMLTLGVIGPAFLLFYKKEIVYALFFFALFLYGFVSSFGYVYAPLASVYINAYTGEDNNLFTVWFINLSLLILLVLYVFLPRNILDGFFEFKLMPAKKTNRRKFILLMLFISLVYFFSTALLFNELGWNENQENSSILFAAYMILHKWVPGFLILLIFFNEERDRRKISLLFFLFLLTFLVVSLKSGARTDMAALFLGLIAGFLSKSTNIFKTILHILPYAIGIFFIFIYVGIVRDDFGGKSSISALSSVLLTDFYPPGHILFAAINYSFVNPSVVFASNFSNSLILLGYPYLQAPITELFNPDVVTRNTGYAFYVFTEGYMALGKYGFLYNGLVLWFWSSLWLMLSKTNNKNFNVFFAALMATMIFNFCRGQTSYFFKYFYIYAIPSIIIYLNLIGHRLTVKLK